MSRIFIQIDLKQAESRFVAYDSCDENLIGALEDPKRDIHSEVGAEIFGVPVSQVRAEHKAGNSDKRQLGKKSGHSANYDGKPITLQESCLKEMNLVLSTQEATRISEAYHKLFPGIRRWHAELRETIRRERKLRNPLGRVRYFYGRMDDNTFREGYAYRPQSTVPDVVNHLMLALVSRRGTELPDFWLHIQCHDSITLSAEREALPYLADFADDLTWHPEVILPAGRLRIPVDIQYGISLGDKTSYERQ